MVHDVNRPNPHLTPNLRTSQLSYPQVTSDIASLVSEESMTLVEVRLLE